MESKRAWPRLALSAGLGCAFLALLQMMAPAARAGDSDPAGTTVCLGCHPAAGEAAAAHRHWLTIQVIDDVEDDVLLLGDFGADALAPAQAYLEDADRPPLDPAEIRYVIGSGRLKQVYVYATPDDELALFPTAWNVEDERWDPPRSRWLSASLAADCAICHTMTSFQGKRHLGIQCETCHGPGQDHAIDGLSGDTVPGSYAPPEGLCTNCHVPAQPHSWATPHAAQPETMGDWLVTIHSAPFTALQAGEIDEASCTETCHAGAAWNPDWPAYVEQVMAGEQATVLDILRATEDVACLRCHNHHAPDHDIAAEY